MLRSVLLSIIILCSSPAVHSQQLSGTVLEKESRKPVDMALVRSFGTDSRLLGYAYTEQDGKFRLDRQDDIQFLTISCMGYESANILIDAFQNNGIFLLGSSTFRLKEVVVSSKRIQEKQDTLVYSVVGFTHPQDRSIADVMAKMPGIEVKTDGRISFNGVPINKFYIEGMDLMNEKYALISNNLSRTKVKAVEILKNHQPIAVLRGKNFSESAAVNLILEDDAKLNLTGTADIGMGYNGKDHLLLHDNRLMAMLFRKNRQNFSIYKSNGTGHEISREVRSIRLQEDISQTQQKSSIVNTPDYMFENLPQERYLYNQTHLVATNHLEKTGRHSTLRVQMSYLNNTMDNSREDVTKYVNIQEQDAVVELFENHYNQQILDGSACYELNSDRYYVNNRLKASLEWTTGRNRVFLNGKAKDASTTPQRKYLQDNLHITFPISSKNTAEWVASVSYNDMPQNLLVVQGNKQYLHYTSTNAFSTLSLTSKVLGFYLKNSIGMEMYRQRLSSWMENDAKAFPACLDKYVPQWKATLTYKKGIWEMNGNAWLKWWNVNSSIGDYKGLLPEWSLHVRLSPNATSALVANWSMNNSFDSIDKLYPYPLFTGYRDMEQSEARPDRQPTNTMSLRYEYSHPIRGLFFTSMLQHVNTQVNSVMQTELNSESIYLRKLLPAKFSTQVNSISARLSKSFNLWKCILSLSGHFIQSGSKRMIKGKLEDVEMKQISGEMSVSMKPLRCLDLEGNTIFCSDRIASPFSSTKVSNLSQKIVASLSFSQKVSLSFRNEYSRFWELGRQVIFTDLSLRYTASRIEIELLANNLLGKDIYQQSTISQDYMLMNTYKLRPREMLCKVSFNF